jgi:hypothetical protein
MKDYFQNRYILLSILLLSIFFGDSSLAFLPRASPYGGDPFVTPLGPASKILYRVR